jgi:hypothetical protein
MRGNFPKQSQAPRGHSIGFPKESQGWPFRRSARRKQAGVPVKTGKNPQSHLSLETTENLFELNFVSEMGFLLPFPPVLSLGRNSTYLHKRTP